MSHVIIDIAGKPHMLRATPGDIASLRALLADLEAKAGLVPPALPAGDDLPSLGSPADGRGGCGVAQTLLSACKGLESAPPDLLEFVRVRAVREVAGALGISRRTAHRLQGGYWPRDARQLLRTWNAYMGRSTEQSSGWFLRRVHLGGLVRHAGSEWSAYGLAERTGQTLAVARVRADALLAQTLDMPPHRLQLMPVALMVGGAA